MVKRYLLLIIILSLAARINSFMIPLTVEELAVVSDTIITGTVTQVEPYWDDTTGLIFSKVTIAIEEQLRGEDLGPFCEVHILGGIIGDVGLSCPNYPRPVVGEKAVYFLSTDTRKNILLLREGKQAQISLDNLTGTQIRDLRLRINKILNILDK